MQAHFFNIEVLIRVDSQVWLVDRNKPSIPIIKITKSEFNLIKKGIYRTHNSSLSISGTNYWLPNNLMNDLKIKSKSMKFDITDLVFSMQEFMNSSVIENIDYEILTNHFQHLKNTNDHIYIICSKNNRKNYQSIIKKLEDELSDIGLIIENYYYLSETFYNRDKDYIASKKVKLLLQHLLGYKTDDNKFTNEEITKYDRVYYYDDEPNSIKLAKDSNYVFKTLLDNSDDDVKDIIKNIVKSYNNTLIVNNITHNRIMPFDVKEITIELYYVVKTFERFNINRL
jgi:hypothetical protein